MTSKAQSKDIKVLRKQISTRVEARLASVKPIKVRSRKSRSQKYAQAA